jgi:ABC-type multidrug transport system fused ATPase/permease subunit
MKTFLEKIKLIQYTSIELNTEKNDFVRKLRQNIDESDLSWGSSMFEAFSSSKNDYKGTVNFNGFKLRKRQRMFQNNLATKAIAKGSFNQKEDKLIIDIEVNGFNNFLAFFFVFICLFYVIFIGAFLSNIDNELSIFFLLFIILHGFIMIFLPLYFIRKGVKNMKRDLEKEFVYITNK